jgi:thioredoxin 1
MSPILEEVVTDIGDKVKVIKVDVDTNSEAASKYGIRSVPTLLLFKEGKIVWKKGGVSPKKIIIENIKKVM